MHNLISGAPFDLVWVLHGLGIYFHGVSFRPCVSLDAVLPFRHWAGTPTKGADMTIQHVEGTEQEVKVGRWTYSIVHIERDTYEVYGSSWSGYARPMHPMTAAQIVKAARQDSKRNGNI